MKRYVTKVIQSPGKWLEIGGKRFFFRSKWERQYARYLQFQKEQKIICEWDYEPHTFWFDAIKRGVTSYKPDFQVWPESDYHYWVEVKGFMDPKSLTKLKRMAKYHPSERIVVVDAKWFRQNGGKLKMLIKGWE